MQSENYPSEWKKSHPFTAYQRKNAVPGIPTLFLLRMQSNNSFGKCAKLFATDLFTAYADCKLGMWCPGDRNAFLFTAYADCKHGYCIAGGGAFNFLLLMQIVNERRIRRRSALCMDFLLLMQIVNGMRLQTHGHPGHVLFTAYADCKPNRGFPCRPLL